jgi:hypothetical protein
MAQTITIEGKVDNKPMSQELTTKVQHALKGALEQEFTVIKPATHWSITHISITANKVT